MKRITVSLTDHVHARLRDEAERRGANISALTREAIESYLGIPRRRHLLAAKAGRSGHADISARMEELIAPFEGHVGTRAPSVS
jgi:hypothetical protein